MRISKCWNPDYTGPMVYIVVSVDGGGYDSYDIEHHMSKRSAMKSVIRKNYELWQHYRYLSDYNLSYESDYYIREAPLYNET